ncbi:MAG: MATE family efflux transporter [Pseudomonadota bacterium]
MTDTAQDRPLTEGSVVHHLIRLAIPAAMGMVFNTLYNLTDFWFAGMLSDAALAGVSIAGSVFFLIIGIGAGMQSGTTAMIASEVGAGREGGVRTWLNQALGVGCVVALVSLAVGFWVAEDLIRFLGAEPDVEPSAQTYAYIVLAGNVTFVLAAVATGALVALGDTKSARNALAIGFFANFALNPLLTFGLGLGVTGLALSTVLIKLISAVYLVAVLRRRLDYTPRPVFDLARWRELLYQVLPASFNMLMIILGGFITVSFVGRFGSDHVAGYAVGLRLEQVLLLPALGLNSAVMALVGQNFGAGQVDRVIDTYKKALLIGVAIALVSVPVMVFLSPLLVSVFSSNADVIATGSTYLRIDALAFFSYVVLFVSVASLQAVKQPLFPMVLGIARQLVLPASINYVLIVHAGLPMVSLFITIVSVVVISSIVTNWYTLRQLRAL